MSDTLKTYVADHELAELIRTARTAGKPLRVRAGEEVYELDVRESVASEDIWENYDPEAALQALEESAGVLTGVDVETLIEELKAEREQDTPGRPAW